MSAFTWLLAPEMAPFSISIGIVAGLFGLEVVALLLGGSLFGMGADGPDTGADFGADADIDAGGFDAADPGGPELDGFEVGDADSAEIEAAEVPGAGGGPLSWLGIGEVHFAIWLAGILTAFGLTGYLLQLGVATVTGGMIPGAGAAFLALVPALWLGRGTARLIGRLVPKTHSEAVSQRHLGGRTGVVTAGTAEAGRPAQARVTDRYGNIQYLRIEPFRAGQKLPQGTEIVVLWGKGPVYKALPLEDAEAADMNPGRS